MRRVRRTVSLLGVMLLLAANGQAQPDALRVRVGQQGTAVMVVQGIDEAGRIRLRPETGTGGEALIPLPEARDLQFELPADYRKAQQLAFAGRTGEAVFLLRRLVPALVPYAAVPGSNATGVVRFYFKLVVGERAWADAIAMAVQLPLGTGELDFVPEVVALARALQAAGRVADVTTVMERVQLATKAHRRLVWALADEMRRRGYWREAQALYEKLSGAEDVMERARLQLLLAYTDWHLGTDLGAQALLSVMEPPPADTEHGVLYRLLRGRVALGAGDGARALDELAEALIGIEGASEWRVEITAVIAEAYRAEGRDELADLIEADLRRLHPKSRWLASISN